MRHRLLFLLATLLTIVQGAWADDFLQKPSNFTAYVQGIDKIRFTLPTQMWSTFLNEGITEGLVYVSIDGAPRQLLIEWNAGPNYRDIGDKISTTCQAKGHIGGKFELVGKTDGGTKTFRADDDWTYYKVKCNDDDDDHYTTTIDWTVPRSVRGHNLVFELWCHSRDRDYHYYLPKGNDNKTSFYRMAEWSCPDAPEVSVQLSEPQLAYDPGHVNSIMFTYSISAKKVNWARLHAVDALTGKESVTSVNGGALVGMLYLPADRPYSKIFLETQVVDTEGNTVSEALQSDPVTSDMLHNPVGLSFAPTPDGKMRLDWKVDHAELSDIVDGDYFEIQRNVTGATDAADPYWTTISASVAHEKGVANYTFTDETLMNQYQGRPVSYRVRRMYTSMWQWAASAGHCQATLPWVLVLPRIESATVSRTAEWNDEQHLVEVAFTRRHSDFDADGNFLVRSDEDYQRLLTNISEGKASWQKALFFISSQADWDRMARLVSEGRSGLHCMLTGNLTLSASSPMVGTENQPFIGVFDGNGYTLSFDYQVSEDYAAPFRYVRGATIKNLHTTGSITNTEKFASGLIGRIEEGTNVIDHCWASVTLNSSINGDATNGGFVGVLGGGSLEMKDCSFDGQFLGSQCYNNGGLVGWADSYSRLSMVNCLFAPQQIATLTSGCSTFVRASRYYAMTLDNCYYTHPYGTVEAEGRECMAICNADDWAAFCDAIQAAGAGGELNAVLMADISTTRSAGTGSVPFHGYFNGNGHTLNVAIDGGTSSPAAPFTQTKGATIRNLHVTGTVVGGIHASGLIGVSNNTDVTIDNVWVSAEVTCRSTHLGGFIGHGGSGNHHITNCRFDGKLQTVSGGSGTYGGAIIGWENGGTKNVITNCLAMGTTEKVAHAGMNYAMGLAYGNVNECKNNYSSANWGEMGGAQYRNVSNTSQLAASLGSGWVLQDGVVQPVLSRLDIDAQGSSAVEMSIEELAQKLGQQWQAAGAGPQLKMTSRASNYDYAVWDQRAKLLLRVNMHGEHGVDTRLVDLSANADAVSRQRFTTGLTRKCVEYSFDLLVLRDGSPLKIDDYEGDTLVVPVSKTEQGEMASYRFQNVNQITQLASKKKQSSVQLTWNTSGGDSDYFQVLRRAHTTRADAEWTDTLATGLQQLYYEDKTVQVQQVYDYRVESVLQCEGLLTAGATTTGECEPTGLVEGYLRMADGTAMAGDTVVCVPIGVPGASAEYVAISDETGYYAFSGLPIYIGDDGEVKGEYHLTIRSSGTQGAYTGPNALGAVTFGQNSNWKQNFNFYMDTYFVYSGHVYYDNSSIPVAGVSFKLDGNPMHDASQQLIVTDTQGAFALSIPRGTHRVQAVKEGHEFGNDGYLLNPDATDDARDYNFLKNVAGITLWDYTSVVLRGRVAGGDIEGSKPLGRSLSTNNLGDSLKIVMQLEGDNASYIYRHPKDDDVKSTSYELTFGDELSDTTRVTLARHSITIRPDSKTGEYMLELPPAKYKVVEVSAQGYATLFQAGQVGQTLDLTRQVQSDTCEYSRIYHAVPDVEVTQFNPGNEPYYGVRRTVATDILGHKDTVEIWGYKHLAEQDSIGVYSFGYPVFMANSPYGWMLQACEKYYWNNDITKKVDIVRLDGGTVSIKNYLVDTDDAKLSQTVSLDATGYGSYVFTPGNVGFNMADEMALRTVDITLEYDGNYYDIKPLGGKIMKGFVMATQPKKGGVTTVATGKPTLVDILRDPPGSGSSAYIEAGSKLSYSYSPSFEGSIGASMSIKDGTYTTIYKGAIAMPPTGTGTEAGTISEAHSDKVFGFTLASTFNGSWTTSYNFDVTERIQTKSGAKWIGPKADLFMGTNENYYFQDAIAVRAIPESQYLLMKNNEGGSFRVTDKDGKIAATVKVPVGAMRLITKGTDANGKPVYLVRDEVMSVTSKVASTFIHSQQYIENELLPTIIKQRNALVHVPGVDGQALADAQNKLVYVSTVAPGNSSFGADDCIETYYPSGWNDNQRLFAVNEVENYNQQLCYWLEFLIQNEEEKINVTPDALVKNYDIDGGVASLQYSESFSAGRNKTGFVKWPGLNNANIASLFPEWALKSITKLTQEGSEAYATYDHDDDNNLTTHLEVATPAKGLKIKFTPILSFNYNDKSGENSSKSKKVGFTLSVASKASINVDVYRTTSGRYGIASDTPDPFLKLTADVLKELQFGQPYHPATDIDVYSSFVFRTRGGVTCQPYEGERTTKWYQPGTVIDAATIPSDKPRIWVDEPVVSNVPFDEPARYVLHMANETDYPERATMIFNYYLEGSSNPNGAKVCVDGKPLNSTSESIVLYPVLDKAGKHSVFTKEITVYPSKAFDYENLSICLVDPEDASRVFSQKISAHFIPTGGKVNISVPSDKWVVNTESPYDGQRQQWYMPVRIEGFDINWPNFDHIELQYKLSTQGDKDWVSVCSYYADRELQRKASGVTDTIPNSGIIVAPFYGEKDPVEQHYDLRAVTFCRHAGGYLTGMSQVLSGIKDTRRPQSFGTPEPTNGILDIGGDIKIAFSEPIAGNYLTDINNFEVLGTPVSTDVATSTSLYFSGETLGGTHSRVNLVGKSFTVDIMLNPAEAPDKDMIVWGHGGAYGLRLGLTKDFRLCARIDEGERVESDGAIKFNGMLSQVAYAVAPNDEGLQVTFYDGNRNIGTKQLTKKYTDNSLVALATPMSPEETAYKGEMLEYRLWNRLLGPEELKVYGQKQLTGYEAGLMNYYKLNDGKGEYCMDKASSSNDLWLMKPVWKSPVGLSLKFDGTKAAHLDIDKFTRSREHDYTMTFWFRAETDSATLISNGEALRGQDNQLLIGLREGSLFLRSSGFELPFSNVVDGGAWHHFAMTVSRARNVANVYLDSRMVESFPADSLSGIQGNELVLGGTLAGPGKTTEHLKGNIDELGMFSSVLPLNLIEEYSTKTPLGQMDALMAYLDFGSSEKQNDGSQRLMPSGVSVKRYVDNQGITTERRDTLMAVVDESMFDRQVYAPMRSIARLDNLKYSWVARDHELLISVDEPVHMIEKTNLYVTVKDVADLNGNLMASPVTLNLYVYKNPLRWDIKKVERNVDYGYGCAFEATVKNLSSERKNFEIQDLPLWITASQTTGTLGALEEQIITFTISPYINIGTYNEIITLAGDDKMSEPLPLKLVVRGESPEWMVNDRLRQANQTMMMVARVKIDGAVANSPEDVLAVFDDNMQTLGVTHLEVDNAGNANEALAYLTIYGYTNMDGSKPKLNFRFYNSNSGHIYTLMPDNKTTYYFDKDEIVGTTVQPVLLVNSSQGVQTLALKTGWNWVSFNMAPEKEVTVGQFLNNSGNWQPGDIIKSVSGSSVQQWTCFEDKNSPRGFRWEKQDEPILIDCNRMYQIYSNSDKLISIEGSAVFGFIEAHQGWNRIGYTSLLNLPVQHALSDYSSDGSEGDVIKSQDAFAVASMTSQGLVWKGTLQFMEAGKGYMLKRKSAQPTTFFYPDYWTANAYSGDGYISPSPALHTATTMNIVASVSGVDTETGDQLAVYCGAERLAAATADSEQRYYLNIGSDRQPAGTFTFALERDGEIIAMTGSHLDYQADQLLGTPSEPTAISFTSLDEMPHDGKWYSVAGIKYDQRPAVAGMYVHNGKAVVVGRAKP